VTSEEFEKRMEFIVEQQAQFAADIQRLEESQARLQEAQTRNEQAVSQMAGTVSRMAESVSQIMEAVSQMGQAVSETQRVVTRLANVTHAGFQDQSAKINALLDSHIRLADAQSRTDERLQAMIVKVDALTESQSQTSEAVRSLANTVERYLRESRNGEPRD